MSVDIFINFAQDYANNKDHNSIKNIFSVGREVQLSDLKTASYVYKQSSYANDLDMVAEESNYNSKRNK